MECDWELRRQGDVRYVLTRIPPNAAAIIEHAAQTEPSLGLKFRTNKEGGVLRWAKGVPHELVRSAVEAAVTGGRAVDGVAVSRAESNSTTANKSSDSVNDTSIPALCGGASQLRTIGRRRVLLRTLEDAVCRWRWRVQINRIRTMHNGELSQENGIDAFADFAENYRWRKRKEFVRWLKFSDDLHTRLTKAAEKHSTHHAMERAWERLPQGPIQLDTSLSSRYKVMEVVRLRFFVEGAGSADFTADASTLLTYSASSRTPPLRNDSDYEHLDVSDDMRRDVIRTIEAAETRRNNRPSGTKKGDLADPDDHNKPPASFVRSFTNGLRIGAQSATAFRVRSLRAVTTLGTLVFDARGTTLITFISDHGNNAYHTWLSSARLIEQQSRRRWYRTYAPAMSQ